MLGAKDFFLFFGSFDSNGCVKIQNKTVEVTKLVFEVEKLGKLEKKKCPQMYICCCFWHKAKKIYFILLNSGLES